MMYSIGPAKGIAMLLISLGVGYIVCAKAEEKKGLLKQLGYLIGAVIIIVSILKGLCGLYYCLGNKLPFKYLPPHVCPMMPAK